MNRPVVVRIAGVVMACVAAAGIVQGARAAVAQATYYKAKFRSPGKPASAVIEACVRAHRLYPWNYNVCELAAETAFREGLRDPGAMGECFRDSILWCDRGLALSPRNRALTYRKAAILGADEKTRPDALKLWSEFTGWNYWNADNHLYLGMMHAATGNLADAEREAILAKNSTGFQSLELMIGELKQRQ